MKKIITLSIVMLLSLVSFNAEAKTKKESCSKKMMQPKKKSLVKYHKTKKFHAYLEKNAQFMFNNASEDVKFMLLNGQI
jgi:hypothetical protein